MAQTVAIMLYQGELHHAWMQQIVPVYPGEIHTTEGVWKMLSRENQHSLKLSSRGDFTSAKIAGSLGDKPAN